MHSGGYCPVRPTPQGENAGGAFSWPFMRNFRPIRVDGDLAYITLTKGYEAVIDAADVHLVDGFNWYANTDGHTVYAQRGAYANGAQKTTRLHRVLMGVHGDLLVDHIDGDGLNNRRSNLRVATHAQNQRNQRLVKRNSSGFKGVSWDKEERNWLAQIRVDGNSRKLGRYKTPEQAHAAYCAASLKIYGEFARHG